MLTPVTGMVSLRAYARHRGVSATAVHRAIESGRLSQCVKRAAGGKFIGITDIALADREWTATTDLTKAPTAVIARAEEQQQPAGHIHSSDEATEALELSATADTDPERLSPLMRQKYWQAKTEEIKYKKSIGELVDAKEVEERMIEEYSRCRTKLLGIARKAKAALPHLAHSDVLAIDNLVREALDGLAGPRASEAQPESEPRES